MQQPSCTIKVLILLYSKERHAYLGFIPNDQAGFVDRIRKVIQQQKNQQAVMRQGFPPLPGNQLPNMPGTPPQQQTMGQPNQQNPIGIPISNQSGGQMPTLAQQLGQTQPVLGNPVLAQQLSQNQPQIPQQQQHQPQQQQLQQMAQQLNNTIQQQQQQQQQQTNSNVVDSTSADLYEIERQQNLLKIQQLQQTLQQAQQRELQYQQLHSIPGLPGGPPATQQQQMGGGGGGPPPMQVSQQQQPMHQQMQQQQQPPQIQGIPRQMMTPQNAGQQMRMMRPSVAQGNPGLRHLLQQQAGPNYRMQNMQMQGMQRIPGQVPGQMPGGGPLSQGGQVNQFEDVGILDLLK